MRSGPFEQERQRISEIREHAPSRLMIELGAPTGHGVRIGVIDSGWDHALFNRQVQKGISFVDPGDGRSLLENEDDQDQIGHGTACIDLILSCAPEAEVIPIRVFGPSLESSVDIVNAGIRWAISRGLRLLNLSLGTMRADALKPMYSACELARESGMIIIAARDNYCDWSYPSVFENVIGVTSGDFEGRFDFNYNPNEGIECTSKGKFDDMMWLRGRKVSMAGNSLAAANMTGIVALLLERFPRSSLEDVRGQLLSFSKPLAFERLDVATGDSMSGRVSR